MSGNVVGWVLRNYSAKTVAERTRKSVLLAIAESANPQFEGAHPGVQHLADSWGLHPGTIRRHLSALVQEGWLEVEMDGRGREATTYRVRKERAQSAHPEARQSAHPSARQSAHPESALQSAQSSAAKRAKKSAKARIRGGSHNSCIELSNTPQQTPAAEPLVAQPLIEAPSLVDAVFAQWKLSTHRNGHTLLTPKRKKLIETALQDYGLDDVLDAVRGVARSEWHMERGHTDLTLILRDGGNTERFRDLERRPTPERRPSSRPDPVQDKLDMIAEHLNLKGDQ